MLISSCMLPAGGIMPTAISRHLLLLVGLITISSAVDSSSLPNDFASMFEPSASKKEKQVDLVIPPDLPSYMTSTNSPKSSMADDRSILSRKLRARASKTLTETEADSPRPKALASDFPVVPSDATYGADDTFKKFDGLTDSRGILHRPRSRSPFTKPGLWEANPDNPHNRDHANKFYYHPRSVGVDWLNGQLTWGAHWAVPAVGTGGTDGFSAVHFPTIGTFLNIPDDYD